LAAWVLSGFEIMPLAAFPKCFLDALCVRRDMKVDTWLDLAAQLKVDGVEFYWHFTPWNDHAELKRLRQRVQELGLSIPMFCYSPDFTKPDRQERKTEIEQQKVAIQTASMLGARFCRVLTGQRRPEISREQGLAWVNESLEELVPFARDNGIVLTLENHYKDGFWAYPEFAQKMDLFLEVLQSFEDCPTLGVNYDPSNALVAGDDPIVLLEEVKHRVVTMHASDRYLQGGNREDLERLANSARLGYASILKHGVIGRGLNDYDRIFSILKAAGFKGWISIEDGDDPVCGMEHLKSSVEFLREKMRIYRLT
jgi:sugar phosphate isomerase/epimerase